VGIKDHPAALALRHYNLAAHGDAAGYWLRKRHGRISGGRWAWVGGLCGVGSGALINRQQILRQWADAGKSLGPHASGQIDLVNVVHANRGLWIHEPDFRCRPPTFFVFGFILVTLYGLPILS